MVGSWPSLHGAVNKGWCSRLLAPAPRPHYALQCPGLQVGVWEGQMEPVQSLLLSGWGYRTGQRARDDVWPQRKVGRGGPACLGSGPRRAAGSSGTSLLVSHPTYICQDQGCRVELGT